MFLLQNLFCLLPTVRSRRQRLLPLFPSSHRRVFPSPHPADRQQLIFSSHILLLWTQFSAGAFPSPCILSKGKTISKIVRDSPPYRQIQTVPHTKGRVSGARSECRYVPPLCSKVTRPLYSFSSSGGIPGPLSETEISKSLPPLRVKRLYVQGDPQVPCREPMRACSCSPQRSGC